MIGEFQTNPSPPRPRNFQNENFEKIYFKCIHIRNFICFELSFKASESLNLLISSLWVPMFCQNFLNISTPFGVKLYSWLQPPLWEKWCYNPVACSVCANLLGFSKEDWYDCLLILNSNLFLLFFTAFHWNILTAITSRHMF